MRMTTVSDRLLSCCCRSHSDYKPTRESDLTNKSSTKALIRREKLRKREPSPPSGSMTDGEMRESYEKLTNNGNKRVEQPIKPVIAKECLSLPPTFPTNFLSQDESSGGELVTSTSRHSLHPLRFHNRALGGPAPNYQRRITCVNFEVPGPVEQIFRTDRLPSQVSDLLVYLAREAIDVPNLFRRSGAVHDIKHILRQLRDGTRVSWTQYSFHTLANVAKKFLLSVDGGILGADAEEEMLHAMTLPTAEMTMEVMHRVIISLSLPVQSLLVLLFGVWFRMMCHSEVNQMSLEAVAKSVAGSVFRNSCAAMEKVDSATKAMQFLIQHFPSSALFGPQLLHYFTQQSKTSLVGMERYEYALMPPPPHVPREEYVREFVRALKRESDRHGFDLLRDVVTKETFDAVLTSYPQVDVFTSANRLIPPHPNDSTRLPIPELRGTELSPLRYSYPNNQTSYPPTNHTCRSATIPLSTTLVHAISASVSDTNFTSTNMYKSILNEEATHRNQHTTLPIMATTSISTSTSYQTSPRYLLSSNESQMSLFPPEVAASPVATSRPLNSDAIFQAICQRQMQRMQQRSAWFLQQQQQEHSTAASQQQHKRPLSEVFPSGRGDDPLLSGHWSSSIPQPAAAGTPREVKLRRPEKAYPNGGIRPSWSQHQTMELPWLWEEEEATKLASQSATNTSVVVTPRSLQQANESHNTNSQPKIEKVYFVVKRVYGPR